MLRRHVYMNVLITFMLHVQTTYASIKVNSGEKKLLPPPLPPLRHMNYEKEEKEGYNDETEEDEEKRWSDQGFSYSEDDQENQIEGVSSPTKRAHVSRGSAQTEPRPPLASSGKGKQVSKKQKPSFPSWNYVYYNDKVKNTMSREAIGQKVSKVNTRLNYYVDKKSSNCDAFENYEDFWNRDKKMMNERLRNVSVGASEQAVQCIRLWSSSDDKEQDDYCIISQPDQVQVSFIKPNSTDTWVLISPLYCHTEGESHFHWQQWHYHRHVGRIYDSEKRRIVIPLHFQDEESAVTFAAKIWRKFPKEETKSSESKTRDFHIAKYAKHLFPPVEEIESQQEGTQFNQASRLSRKLSKQLSFKCRSDPDFPEKDLSALLIKGRQEEKDRQMEIRQNFAKDSIPLGNANLRRPRGAYKSRTFSIITKPTNCKDVSVFPELQAKIIKDKKKSQSPKRRQSRLENDVCIRIAYDKNTFILRKSDVHKITIKTVSSRKKKHEFRYMMLVPSVYASSRMRRVRNNPTFYLRFKSFESVQQFKRDILLLFQAVASTSTIAEVPTFPHAKKNISSG